MHGKIITRTATLLVNDAEDGLLSSVNDVAAVDCRDMHSISLYVNMVVDDPAQTNGTKSSLDLEGPGTNIDTVVQATSPGTDGDAIGITFQDGSLVDEGELTVVGTEVTFAFKDGVTTVADFEAAVGALVGDDAIIEVKTAGTGASVLATTDDEFVSQNLAGGTDGEGGFDIVLETSLDGLNYAPLTAFDETDFADGSNLTIEYPVRDANGMPKRVGTVKATLTSLDDGSKFSITAVGIQG